MIYPILKLEKNGNFTYDNSWKFRFYYEDFFGNILSKEKYRYAKSFNNGYAFVYKEDKTWDIINSVGESQLNKFKYCSEIIKLALLNIAPIGGFFLKNYIVSDNIIISVNWKILKEDLKNYKIDIKNSNIENLSHAYLVVNHKNKKISLIEDYSLESNGLIAIKNFNQKWIYIEEKDFRFHAFNKNAFGQEFDCAFSFFDGKAKVKVGNKYGFIKTNGDFLIETVYDDARSFHNGYAAVAIANCSPNISNWNSKKRFSDLAWNFIDCNNSTYLSDTKELLSMIDSDLNFFFKNQSYSTYVYDTSNLNSDYHIEKSRKGISSYLGYNLDYPSSDYWYGSTIWGQLYPSYIANLLTAELGAELGFKNWNIDNNHLKESSTFLVKSRKWPYLAESIFIDFDTTQSEFDYIFDSNSIQNNYGDLFSSMKWKSIRENKTSSNHTNLDIDWSNYNDDLDMDQQDIDFWNQF